MATIKASEIVESYVEVVPGASSLAETYLQAVVTAVRAQQLEVELGTIQATSGFFRQLRGEKREFVVVDPRNPSLEGFRFYHFAAPAGINLALGWYLTRDPMSGGALGAAKLATAVALHAATKGAAAHVAESMMRLDVFDQADLQALMQCIHTLVVREAVFQIADSVGYPRDRLGAKSKGFFGIGG